MTTTACPVFRWCAQPAGHDADAPGRPATAHLRGVHTGRSRTLGIIAEVSLRGDAEREAVNLVVSYDWSEPYRGTLHEVAPDLAETLGTVILTFSPDELTGLGEALLTGGRTLMATWTEGGGGDVE